MEKQKQKVGLFDNSNYFSEIIGNNFSNVKSNFRKIQTNI